MRLPLDGREAQNGLNWLRWVVPLPISLLVVDL